MHFSAASHARGGFGLSFFFGGGSFSSKVTGENER